MSTTTDVATHALQLPKQERADLAHQLLLSLEREELKDDEVAVAWQDEIEQRLRRSQVETFRSTTGGKQSRKFETVCERMH